MWDYLTKYAKDTGDAVDVSASQLTPLTFRLVVYFIIRGEGYFPPHLGCGDSS